MKQLQTVYIPIKVEDELPNNECFNINFHNQLHCGYISKNTTNGGYKSENNDSTSNNLTHWLKPAEVFIFTPEELHKLISDYYDAGMLSKELNLTLDNLKKKDIFHL